VLILIDLILIQLTRWCEQFLQFSHPNCMQLIAIQLTSSILPRHFFSRHSNWMQPNVLFLPPNHHQKKQEAKSSSNLGLDFLLSNRSMKRRYSAASMLGHQTQRKAEDLIDAGMKSVVSLS